MQVSWKHADSCNSFTKEEGRKYEEEIKEEEKNVKIIENIIENNKKIIAEI